MSSPIAIQSERAGAGLELHLRQLSDRWQHLLMLRVDGVRTLLLSSVEGTDEDIWPTSPPLQEIANHETAAGPAVLGMGMAGSNHWSASIAPESDDQPKLVFDLACSLRGSNDRSNSTLMSTYRVIGGYLDQQCFVWKHPDHRIELKPIFESGMEFSEDVLRICPGPNQEAAAATVRWGFVVRID